MPLMPEWYQWCDSSTVTSCSTSAWLGWISSASTTSISTTWASWCRVTLSDETVYLARFRQPTAEERLVEEQWKKKAAEEQAKRKAAEERARKLLEENLVLKERERLQKNGHFVVHGRSGCRYRINRGRSGNVDVIDKSGVVTHRLCVHPIENVPDHDTMLAQKLMIEHDEEEFNRVANKRQNYGSTEPVMEAIH